MSCRVEVAPAIYSWAIERSGKSLPDLQKAFPCLLEWQSGDQKPTLIQLEDFADATHAPIGYFFGDDPPHEDLPITDFRTMVSEKHKRPSGNLLDNIYLCQRRQDWYREYSQYWEFDLPTMLRRNKFSVKTKIEKASEIIRKDFEFDSQNDNSNLKTFSNRCKLVEQKGVLVMCSGFVGSNNTRKLEINEFRGFCLYDQYAPLIFINGQDTNNARSFTLMHELAHLYLGQSALSDVHFHSSNAQESWCNRVAAELLVPLGDFKNQCNQNQIKEESHIAELARYYNVSELVILLRIYDLKYWNEIDFRKHFQAKSEELKKLAIEIKEKNKKAGGGGNPYNTKLVATSKIFARAVTESAKNHQTLYRDAMDLLAIKKTATFEKLYLRLHGE